MCSRETNDLGSTLQAATLCSVNNISASWCHQQDIWGSKKLSRSHSMLLITLPASRESPGSLRSMSMGLQGTGASAWWECHHAASWSEATQVWVCFHALAQSCATLYGWNTGAEPVLDGERGKNPLSDGSLVHFFSPNCPNAQKASVLLTDVSLPRMPKGKVAQEDGKRRSVTRTPTWMEMSQATWGQQLAPSAAAQPAKPLPSSKAFSSSQVARVGDRKDASQVQSTNYFTLPECAGLKSHHTASSRVCRCCANQYYLLEKVKSHLLATHSP